MNEQEDGRNPEIQVDDGWKSRVAAEKHVLSELEQDDPPGQRPALPPAGLATLVSNFATQALVSLGTIPEPVTGKPSVDLELARFAIDMLEVIQEKTKGNLDEGETRMVENTLLELRMAYLEVAKAPPASAAEPPPGDAAPKSRIIAP